MAEFVEVLRADELRDGAMKMVSVGEREFLVARVGDKYYAADNRCPHMGGNLSQGRLEGTVVTCPRHRSQFDLTDGHVIRWTNWTGLQLFMTKILRPPRPLRIYDVKVEDGVVLAGIGKAVLPPTGPTRALRSIKTYRGGS